MPIRVIVLLPLLALGFGGQGDQAAPAVRDTVSRTAPAAVAAALDQGPRSREVLVLDGERAARGEVLFETASCADCHVLGENDLAPNLLTVLDARTLPWLEKQITEPEWMLEHDPITQTLYEAYGLEMVDMGVSADDAADILHFLLRETEAAER